jgi:glutathione S-transferase
VVRVTIKLYDYVLSVNCYKQRLMMSILDVPYQSVPVDFYPGWEHKGEAFRKINPLGHIPVIDDDGYVLRDAHAILVYLAAKYDPTGRWYPLADPELIGEVAQWMLFAEGTTNTASAARLHVNLGYDFDIEACRSGAHRLFRVLDEHLWFREQEGGDWLCSGDHPTVADIAVFPDVILSEEGGISRLDYPAIRRWTDRVKRTPGFEPMPGIFPAGSLPPPPSRAR